MTWCDAGLHNWPCRKPNPMKLVNLPQNLPIYVMAILVLVCLGTIGATGETITTTATLTSTSTSTTTAALTSTTTPTCPTFTACNNDVTCRDCLAKAHEVWLYLDTRYPHALSILDNDFQFWTNMTTKSSCGATNEETFTFYSAIYEIGYEKSCDEAYRHYHNTSRSLLFDSCQMFLAACAMNDQCRSCVDSVYKNQFDEKSVADALSSESCRRVEPWLLQGMALGTCRGGCSCAHFPKCDYWMHLCSYDPMCLRCLNMFRQGDGASAALECPDTSANNSTSRFESNPGQNMSLGMIFAALVNDCASGYEAPCAFWRQRCESSTICKTCMRDLGNGRNPEAIVKGSRSRACDLIRHESDNSVDYAFFNFQIQSCPRPSVITECDAILELIMVDSPPSSGWADVLESCWNGSLSASDKRCNFMTDVRTACDACPSQQRLINLIAVIMTVVGGTSCALCTMVILTMISRGRDLVSLRDRAIVFMMIANIVFSGANTVPIISIRTDDYDCGNLALPFGTIRFVRAWWFGGKYLLVGFELMIVGTSIMALTRGADVMGRKTEAATVAACVATGITAFVMFHLVSSHIGADYNATTERDMRNAVIDGVSHSATESDDFDVVWEFDGTGLTKGRALQRFNSGRRRYDELVQNMLIVWNMLLGVTAVLWVCLRVAFSSKLRAWRISSAEIARQESDDVWAATRRSEWHDKHELLRIQREGYAEISKPLEQYILVFIIFGVPSLIMSTNYCQDRSGTQERNYLHLGENGELPPMTVYPNVVAVGTCDAWCELVLAFRSLATVVVYLMPHRRRREFIDVGGTWRALCSRVINGWWAPPVALTAFTADAEADGEDFGVEMPFPARKRTVARINEDDLVMEKRLAQGGFGEVWQARWSRLDSPVAVKIALTVVDEDGDVVDNGVNAEFAAECESLERVSHPNLLTFHGFGICRDGKRFIVTELMSLGSLHSLLADRMRSIEWSCRISIALQVAMGMEHLHSIAHVHRDLKSANVLLDSVNDGTIRAAVGDFGAARQLKPRRPMLVYSAFTGLTQELNQSVGATSVHDTSGLSRVTPEQLELGMLDECGTMTKARGTLLWMAPEVFRGDTNYGPAIDLYSFGIMLWELSTREVPWAAQLRDSDNVSMFEIINTALQTGQRPTIPKSLPVDHPLFVNVMQRCWAGDPNDRPPFSQVVPILAASLRAAAKC